MNTLNYSPVTPIVVVPVGVADGDVRFTLPPQGIDRVLLGAVFRFQIPLTTGDFLDLSPTAYGFTRFPLNFYLGAVNPGSLISKDDGDGDGFPGVRFLVGLPVPRGTSLIVQTTNITAASAIKFVVGLWF